MGCTCGSLFDAECPLHGKYVEPQRKRNMMADKFPILEEKTVTTTRVLKLNRRSLLSLLHGYGIPMDCEITVHVPGGGDWSNTELEVATDDIPIKITWTEKS